MSVNVIWSFDPLNDLIQGLKTKAHRDPQYLAWLRRQKCWSCPSITDITASHIFRGYHGLKNHDWASIPQCSYCHWQMEYHKPEFQKRHMLPDSGVAEKYYQKYLLQLEKPDERTPEQKHPI